MVGGVTSVIGGVGGAAKKAGKTAKTAKAVVKTTAKAGAKEATLAFAEDLGRQVFVDGKSLKEVDYGQSLEAGASAGVTAVIDELDSVLGTKKQLSTTNRKKASQATGVIDDAADASPRKRANALPDAEVMPNRGAVKNAAGGLADAGSAAGSTGRKSKTAVAGSKIKSGSVNKSSPSLTKNQNKIQRQTISSTLSSNTVRDSGQSALPSSEIISTKPDSNDMTRVGRWMSEGEYNKMYKTKQVQMSDDNKVHVANPADFYAYYKQAAKGSIYVEFDVPSNTIFPGGNEKWGIIAGPGSYNDRINTRKGLPPIKEMPKAINIEIKRRK